LKLLQEELRVTALARDAALKQVDNLLEINDKLLADKHVIVKKLSDLQLQVQNSSIMHQLENDETKTLYYTGNEFKSLSCLISSSK